MEHRQVNVRLREFKAILLNLCRAKNYMKTCRQDRKFYNDLACLQGW